MPAASSVIAADTSVAIPLLLSTHPDNPTVAAWARGRALSLTGHSLAESYSALTRMPGDMLMPPATASRMLIQSFGEPLLTPDGVTRSLPEVLAAAGVAGGATYDALVALAAREHDVVLATRDRRALPTYHALGARVEIVG